MNNALRCAIFFIVTFCQVASGSASNWPKLKSGKKNKANLENLNLGKNRNSWRTLYAFGQQNGDNLLEPMDDSSLGPIPLSKNFILKGQSYNQVFINSNGLISFIEPIFDFIPVPFPTQHFTSIAPFWADIDTSSSGTISYREVTTNADLLSKISSDISQLPLQFNASMAFIVTWFQVPSFGNSKETNTFQLVLAIDGPISCIIFNYETIEWSDKDNVYAQAGYNLGDGSTFFTLPGSMTASVKDLSKNSNVDYAGRWIYVVNEEEPAGPSCLFGSECFNYSSSNLYFFGPDFGDAIMPRFLDSFIGPITMSTDFLFKQMVFSEFFINTNGLISFVEPVTDFIPIPFPIQNYISIAPFWSDTDTTQSGQIYHRQILDSKLLMSIGTDIGRKFQKEFNAKWAYIVTWFNVPYYGGPLHKTNTFQLVLASDGLNSYTIFNYYNLEWSHTDYSSIDAQAGFNLGDGLNYFTLAGSMTQAVLSLAETSNCDTKGRWMFDLTDGEFLNSSCTDECFNSSSSILYNFGTSFGDQTAPKILDTSIGPLPIPTNFSFFSTSFSHFYLNTNGLLSFIEPITSYTPIPFPQVNYSAISPFWSDIDTSVNGDIFYRQITDQNTLDQISLDISKVNSKFEASWAFIATWYNVPAYFDTSQKKNTFQVVIAMDTERSFAIINYEKLEWARPTFDWTFAQAGFNLGDGLNYFTLTGSMTQAVLSLAETSNCDTKGRWMFDLDVFENSSSSSNINYFNFSSSVMYDIGTPSQYTQLNNTEIDFSIGPVSIATNFSFFGQIFSQVYINSNGLVSFLQPIVDYTPVHFPALNYISITPFWNDIDITVSGSIYYREITDKDLLDKISGDISRTFSTFNCTWAFIVTWFKVPAYDRQLSETNTFQLVIASSGSISYSIFNYEELKWASPLMDPGNYAQAGFNYGDGFRFLNLPGSLTREVLTLAQTTNNDVKGRWIYRIDDIQILNISCTYNPDCAETFNFSSSILYEFGLSVSDKLISPMDFFEGPIYLAPHNISFFGESFDEIFINSNGLLSFLEPIYNNFPEHFATFDYKVIAPFWSDIDAFSSGRIFYRQTTDLNTLNKISFDVSEKYADFNATTWAFIVTWFEVPPFDFLNDKKNTFQVVIASNGSSFITIFNYEKLEWPSNESVWNNYTLAQAGINLANGVDYLILPGSFSQNVLNLTNLSNCGKPGRWIFSLDDLSSLQINCSNNLTGCLPSSKSKLYQYGPNFGDLEINETYWYAGPFYNLNNFSFFGNFYSYFYINPDGLITFNEPVFDSAENPFPIPNLVSIAPFWAYIDLTFGGKIFYRQIKDSPTLAKISEDICQSFNQSFNQTFNATWAFIVTWSNVMPFFSNSKNTFQVVIVTDGQNSFILFIYGKLEWSFSLFFHAQAGINYGDGFRYISLPGSMTQNVVDLAQDSNVNIASKWIIRSDNPASLQLKCDSWPFLNSSSQYTKLGGEEIEIMGLCLNGTQTASVIFDLKMSLDCVTGHPFSCKFKVPFYDKLGEVPIELVINQKLVVFKTNLSLVAEPGFDLNFDHKFVSGLKPFYELSSAPISFFVSDWRFYNINLIRIENSSSEHTLIMSLTNGLVQINSSIIYQDPTKKKDIEMLYVGLFLSSSKNLKYEIVLPILVVNRLENADNVCQAWYNEQPDANKIMQQLASCPLNFPFQNIPSFFSDFILDLCSPFSPEFCSSYQPGAFICFKSLVGIQVDASVTAGQQCCFDDKGALLIGSPGGGTLHLKHSLNFSTEHIYADIYPYLRCCILSNNCDLYYEKRPSDNGARWTSPAIGGVAGDPHFTTFDGVLYTFNGFGRYTLLQIKEIDFIAQIRTAPIRLVDGSKSRGTVVNAIAVKANNTDHIQIYLENFQTILEINRSKRNCSSTHSLKGLNANSTENKIELAFHSGVNLEIYSTPNSFMVSVSLSSKFETKTTGLLGNFNGDSSDDFILPDGTVLNLDAGNDRDVYEKFGQKWSVDKQQSIFFDLNSFNAKRNANYMPDFMQDNITFSNPNLKLQAERNCNQNLNCLFDYSLTEDLEIAQSNLAFESIVKAYKNFENQNNKQNTQVNSESYLKDTTSDPNESYNSNVTDMTEGSLDVNTTTNLGNKHYHSNAQIFQILFTLFMFKSFM